MSSAIAPAQPLSIQQLTIQPGPELSIQVYQDDRLITTYFGHREGVRNKRTGRIEHLAAHEEDGRIIIRSMASTGAVHEWLASGHFKRIITPSQPLSLLHKGEAYCGGQ